MIRMKTLIAALLAMPLLAACTVGPDLTPTKRMASKGSAFQQALHREYVAFAEDEQREVDEEAVILYNKKAVMAANGKTPQPDNTKKMKGDIKWELEAARQALRAAIGSGGAKNKPNTAAKAQVMFDCWLHEASEGWEPDEIKKCRDAFDAALKRLEARPKMMAKPMMKKKKKKKKAVMLVIYFGHNSAKLDKAGTATVQKAAGMKSKNLLVSGHTDTTGSPKYNASLAEKRANAVANGLRANGVKDYKIIVQAFGEDEPAKVTGDNVRETLNRRVTIAVK